METRKSLEERLNEYILQLENDARVQERIGDYEAAQLIKDIKHDLEAMTMKGRQ